MSASDHYYSDPMVTLYQGDVREVLHALPAESVQTAVSSPPYWSLRDYGIPPSVWGGEEDCEHEWGETAAIGDAYAGTARWQHDGISRAETPEAWTGSRHQAQGETSIRQGRANVEAQRNDNLSHGSTCARCGAWRGALGLEPTPDLFVAHIVEVFREVKRVLRPDGTVWVNLGDSYAGGSANSGGPEGQRLAGPMYRVEGMAAKKAPGLKPKDLVGIPWMVAFALRADGWYLRQDIIWAKPNPMPESVTDRCTKAHEYLFLLSKSGRYYYDADAVREAHAEPERGQGEHESSTPHSERSDGAVRGLGRQPVFVPAVRQYNPAGRNKRSVWTIPTAPFPEAHFATFPPDLVRPCVLAGSSEMGCCAECGAPWVREVETEFVKLANRRAGRKAHQGDMADINSHEAMGHNRVTTTGWSRTCAHDAPAVPCTVLDPFVGSGTTAMVAKQLGRRAIGIDMSAEYLAMAQERVQAVTLPMFAGLQ